MKKKVFSLMMTLVLAFMGVAQANELTVHDGTSTSGFVPMYGGYFDDFTKSEFVFPASELAAMSGGTITGMTFYVSSVGASLNGWNTTQQVFLKEVASTSLSAYSGIDGATVVFQGSLTAPTAPGEMEITFSTPYTYNGGNLLVGVYNITDGTYQFVYFYGESVTGASGAGSNGSSLAGVSFTQRNFLPKTTFTYTGGGGGSMEDQLHVKYINDDEEEVIDALNLGTRPAGCWMEPFHFTMYSEGPNYFVNVLDFTPSDGMFEMVDVEYPINVRPDNDAELVVTTTANAPAGLIERQFVAITEGNRAAHVWPIVVEMYQPEVPDVVELAYDLGTVNPGFEYAGDPAEITPTQLHNDYTLPFPEIEDGEDAVYKFTVENDVILSAHVDEAATNGKVALYMKEGEELPHPMADNNYTGLVLGSSASAMPFEVQIGEGTSTTGYFPFYTLYNYTISENLFLASELAEAGVTSAPMTSLSWYATNAPGYAQQGITIWMANVDDEALTTTSHIVTNMTKVYTGSMTPAIGWNEFVFNEGTFSWDGSSNVLIYCQRNNGSWNSTVQWQATSAMGFNCMAYRYQDSGAYDPTIANTMYTSVIRPNIIMKAAGGRSNRDVVLEEGFEGGSMPAGWTTEGDNDWTVGTGDYSASTGAATGSYNAKITHSSRDDVSYLVTPAMDLSGATAGTVSCNFINRSWSGDIDGFGIYYRVNGGDWNELFYTEDAHAAWTSTGNIALTGFAANYQLGFMMYDDYGYGVGVDDVVVNATMGGVTPEPGISSVSAGPVIENLPLGPGTYFLVASATMDIMTGGGEDPGEEGLRNDETGYMVYINVDEMPCPAVEDFAFSPSPADDEDGVEPNSVTLRWMVPEYATGWRLIFGSTYHPDPNHPQTIMYPEDGSFTDHSMANSYTVRNLWNNTNYFWHVEFNNDACPEGVSSPIWGFTTHLNVPQDLTAVDETVFDDEEIVLNWNAVVDRTYRFYNVYRDGELIGTTQVNNISNTTYTDGPLAYNMDGYTYYVTAVYDEGESAPSNTVNVKVSGYGDVNGHVYEQDGTTGIAGATVTMVGRDEFNVNHTYNFTTNAQGYYSGHIYASNNSGYNGQAAKAGYQTAYEPVQGNPIDINYDETTTPIDYILDENFDPVCGVIAEYYPDSLDPASPYVKVYWGCGLPGSEIIEDFETGDFSMFDWQLDGNYPWSITNYQPYEGEYCMKSGGAGVANVVSNMTVTVEIPADGIMSFFGKISSENNWDYGYFFIDGVQKGQYTGAGSWGEKKFDITAGTHTFQWRYTKDGSVNSNDDCFYVDYITFYKQPEPPQPGWHTYLESEFDNAYRSNVGNCLWGYEYPTSVVSQFAGWNLTKVAVFSDNMYNAVGGNFTCNVYVGGSTPGAGTLASTITVDVPVGLNAWCEYDLTTPVNVTGSDPIWVIWTANNTGTSLGYPAGCASHSSAYGDWWNNGQDGWDHMGSCTWTMKNYFTNRSGRTVAMMDAESAPVAVASSVNVPSSLRTYAKGQEDNTAECINPSAARVESQVNATRSLNHYRVYRTNCYNDGPYTEENTVLLATVWVPDTVYIDVEWADLPAGVYKWGVGAVYAGNRGEMIEAPINWAAPVAITRDATADNDPNPVAGEEGIRAPWDLMANFNCTSGYQYGVASDGENIYVSSWSASSSSQFYKYDMDGNFVEEFNVSGCGQCRDLTYDGQYFYGVANSTTIYCLDLASHSLVGTIASGFGAAQRGITYDPERDGFWVVGNWSGNLTLVNRSGAVQFVGPAPTSASGLAYYKDENDVEHIYCFNNGDGGVYDYNINTNTMGGSVFNYNAAPGATGTPGGCHVGEYNGKMAFFGDMQQNPNLIAIYELRDAQVGPTPGPGGDNLNQLALPRESETIWSNCLDKDMYLTDGELDVTVLLNSADSPEGATISFINYNEAEQEMFPMDDVELDETGYYEWDMFRKGEYQVTVAKEGYETITDSVSIWDATSLRYVMIEIIYGVSDLYVSSTGWAMWGAMGAPVNPNGPQGGEASTFSVDFESGIPTDWTVIDGGSPAGYGWHLGSQTLGTGYGHNGSADLVISQSYDNGYGVIYPDNWLITPAVDLANGSTFSLWACGQDANYAGEHFGVFVSTTGTNPSDFTMVQEWTLTSKGERYSGNRGERAQGTWYQKTVDLSAYAGAARYIAVRHFNCSDMYFLDVDDIELTAGRNEGERHLEHFKVMCTSIDGEPIFNANTPAEQPFCQLDTDQLIEGEHYICKVAAVYSTGMSDWAEVEWQYIACDNYAGTVNGLTVDGNTVTWDYPGGVGPTPPGQGDTFTVDFEAGIPTGWTTIDGGSPTGYGWHLGSETLGTGYGHNGSSDLVISQSYDNNYGVIYPDNWLISPAVALTNGSTFSLWACGQDANYASEHFGVFVSETGTNPSDFTMVGEWTLTSKGERYSGLRGERAQGTWYQKTVDLSAFAGTARYIAVRHFNCSDMYFLDVDDLELSVGAKSNRDELFFNGYVTNPGAMANGGDASWTQGSQGTWGPNCNNGGGYMLADQFTLANAATINELEVYGYQTGSTTTSTFNGMYAQIYNGAPNAGGTVVWGDANTNIMTATAFTGCYRGSNGETTATTRPIMSITAGNLNIELEAGTYYLVYSLTGTSSSGPWGAPHAEPGVGNTGNGLQYTSSGWQTLLDGGSGTPYGCSMKISGTTGGIAPQPTGDILGAMIFVDGEWEAFVEAPTNTYTYEGDGETICVRMVYNGTNTLPEGNIYFSMSCEECEEIQGGEYCEPGAPIHAEVLNATDQVKIWWGEVPPEPMEEWLYYDDGEMQGAVGAGGTVYWGIMLPANSLAAYAGTNLTKVAVMEYNSAGSYTANIYLGGTSAPGTLVSTKTFNCTGTGDWKEVELDTYVPVDGTQNLWITMYQSGITYPATGSNDTGDANGRWVSVDGNSWYDIIDASSGSIDYTWMIRGFVTNMAKGGEVVALPDFQGNVGGELSSVVTEPTAPAFPMMNRAEIVSYNVYRSDDNDDYELVGTVEEDGSGYYEFIDTPEAAGTYYYQVTAVYDNDCESYAAPAFDNPLQDYVTAEVTGLNENDANVALYPNPTKGNVTIEAAGMSRITVVSVLGQVVLDTEVSADNYTLNMAQFNAGMYMVRVYTENGVSVKRVTVMQ